MKPEEVVGGSVLEYRDTNGRISPCKAWMGCGERFEDDLDGVWGFDHVEKFSSLKFCLSV